MDHLFFILQCIYFMLPAYFANMAPVLTKGHFKELKVPIDFNTKFDKQTIFGKHKTFRGLVFGIIYGIILAFIQSLLYRFEFFQILSFIDYSNWFLIGFLLGSGAIIGDLIKSFFKRRLNLRPGRPFIPWDQLDFVAGSLLFSYIITRSWITVEIILTIFIVSFLLHIMANHIAYYTKIRKEKW